MPSSSRDDREAGRDRLVRVVAGPFAGSVGVLVGTTPSGAAQVRLTVAGEEVTVEMPTKDCAAIH